MTSEQKELDRKFQCALSTLDTYIDFEREHVPHDLDDGELTPFKMLESARNIFSEVHKEWREHIGDPIMDKQAIIGDLLHDLARMVETGRLEF